MIRAMLSLAKSPLPPNMASPNQVRFLHAVPFGSGLFSLFASSFCRGVHGHFNGQRPWALADECLVDLMAGLVGRCEPHGKAFSRN